LFFIFLIINLDNFEDEEFYYGDKLTGRNFGLTQKLKEKPQKVQKPIKAPKPRAIPIPIAPK